MKTTVNDAHTGHMLFLKQQLQQLNAIIKHKKICYLDIPAYSNIGDLLILKGALAFFEENEYQITHCLSLWNFYEAAIADDVTIVFQGGGNFGDLYPAHQQHREQIIEKFPHHQIVVLPQTIYFTSPDQYEKSCHRLRKHQNLHICARDTVSYNFAKSMSNNVYLMPDMAHQLYPINVTAKLVPKSTFYFERQDMEFKADIDLLSLKKADQIGDWPNLTGAFNETIIVFMIRTQRLFAILGISRFTATYTSKLWLCYVEYLYKRIIKQFGLFRYVYSARLHGYILANLMMIDNCLIDNSYSKNKNYYDTWKPSLDDKGCSDA